MQALSDSNVKAGFLVTGLILFSLERVLTSLTIVRTPSPPQTDADSGATLTAETPHTTD